MSVVGIVPAAGYGVRVQPLPCSKEVYPVQGRPVMEYLIERMWLGGATQVRVVTRPEKQDVISVAEGCGAAVVLGHPPSLGQSIGLGSTDLADDDVALLGFPDTVWQPAGGFNTLVDRVAGGWEIALGLFSVPNPETCDAVVCDRGGRVTEVEIKSPTPSTSWIWGCAAARVGALSRIDRRADPGERVRQLASEGRAVAVRLSERFVDIGKSRRDLPTPEPHE